MKEYPKLNRNSLMRVKLQKSLYDFVKYFWDTFDGAELKELWLMEYQAEMFQYSVRHFLPDWLKTHWINDDQYHMIKLETGGTCPMRDKNVNNHDLNMPPRHSKSTTHNVVGPVWLNTIVPKEIASVSHIQDLATDFNLKRQKIINSNKFKELFGYDDRLKIVKNTAKEISLKHGGKLFSVGMSNFTGFGADIIVNDDIVSSENAKKDKEVLENARSYWTNTMPTRRNQGDDTIIWNVMQRLAPGDISGMISDDEDLSSQYTKTVIEAVAQQDSVVIYPCSGKIHIIKKGDYLWESRFGNYENVKRLVGRGTFETQYLQNPINSEMTIIKPHMINYITYDEYVSTFLTKRSTEMASFDFPVKGKDESDKTGCVAGRKRYAKLAIYDAFEEKMGYKAQKSYVTNLSKIKPGIIQIYEDKANGSVLIQDLELEVPGIVEFRPGSLSKQQRLDIASVYTENSNVVFVLDKDGKVPKNIKHLIDQLLKYPFVRYDDIIDAYSQIVIYCYTDAALKVYGVEFDENNIVDSYNHNHLPIDLSIHKKGNKWKCLEIAVNYSRNEFVGIREHLFIGKSEDIIPKIKNLSINKRMVYESGNEVYNLLMGIVSVQPNYTDMNKTILSVKNGLVKNRILFMRNCAHAISDMEIFRYKQDPKDDKRLVPATLDDGFSGCMRVCIGANKGNDAIFF